MTSKQRQTGLAVLFFIALTALFTRPLPLHLRTHVMGPLGDNLEYVWKLWWVKHAILDLHQSPLLQPDIFYPFGYQLAYSDITPIHTYLGIPLTALVGPVVTYNLFVLLATVLSGLFTFLYVRRLSDSPVAGLVAGIIFAYCPYRIGRFTAGHLNLLATQWIPLLLLFLELFLEKGRLRDAAGAGLAYAASSLSTWYYGVALGLVLPIYFLVRARHKGTHLPRRSWWTGGLVFVGITTALVIPFLIPYFQVQQAGETRMPLKEAVGWSASLTDYFLPNARHFLWGSWVRDRLPYTRRLSCEFLLGWGLVPSILALYGWRKSPPRSRAGWGWWIGGALVLSLGPVFKLFDVALPLPLPFRWATNLQSILNGLGERALAGEAFPAVSDTHMYVPLPVLLLRWGIPGLTSMRVWARLSLLTTFGVAVWAGMGATAFIRDELALRPPKWRWAAMVLLPALVLFEFYTEPQALVSTGPRAVDEWLAAQPTRSTIIQMPLSAALNGRQMHYTTYHGQRLANGYGTFVSALIRVRYSELHSFPSCESLDLLAGWGDVGVQYVLLDEADVPSDDPLWAAIAAQDRLEPVVALDGVHVFRLH